MNVFGLTAGSVTIKNTAGKTNIGNTKADVFDLTITAGELTASNLESKDLKLKMSAGQVRLSGTFTGNSDIQVSSGKVIMDINGAEKDFNRNIKVTSGSVYIDGARAGSGNVNLNVNNNAGNTLNVKVTAGDIKINFSYS
jgi:DUF4097 and DUF4098 domain-containing protein YvlB